MYIQSYVRVPEATAKHFMQQLGMSHTCLVVSSLLFFVSSMIHVMTLVNLCISQRLVYKFFVIIILYIEI